MASYYIGIDLGTTESTVSVIDLIARRDDPKEKLRSLPIYQMDQGYRFNRDMKTLQSSIYVDRDNAKVYTGEYAKELYSKGSRPLNTIRSVKTRLGGESMIQIPLESDDKNLVGYDMTELSATLLATIRNSIVEQLGTNDFDFVTITIPAGFNSDERKATLDAAHLAGFKNVKLLDEPTAVLLNFLNLEEPMVDEDFFYETKNVLVYDIGGGTLDISVAEVSDEEGDFNVNILGRSQRMDFGGDNIDKFIAGYFLEEFEKINPSIELRSEEDQAKIISRIVSHAEKHKISFNKKMLGCIGSKRRVERLREAVNFEIIDDLRVTDLTLSDERLRNTLYSVINENGSLLLPLEKCLRQIKMPKNNIDLVIMTGGASKFYLVKETIEKYFASDNENKTDIIPFPNRDAVSIGAAIFSHTQDDEVFNKIDISDAMSDSIFVKNGDKYDLLISQNTEVESSGTYNYTFEKVSNNLELFLYYGLEGDEVYKYKEITGVFHRLEEWHTKGDEVAIEWEFDENKVVHLSFEGEKLLTTDTGSELTSLLINDFKLNEV